MISEIEDNAFHELTRLTTLYLDSNRLTRISKGTLAGLNSLLDLYLYFNKISYIANNAFIENPLLRYIAWDVPVALRAQEKYRNVTGNLLFCDCHAMYFKRWLSRHPAIGVYCYEPQHLQDTPIKTLTKEELDKCYDPRVDVTPASTTVKEGSQVSLHCTGTPAVGFLWYRNGSKMINGENTHVSSFGTLLLSNVKPWDEGMYVCAAKNKKSFAIATVSLNVGHKPYFLSSPQSIEVSEGSKIILPCSVVSDPPSRILWKKYEDEVALNDERVFQTFEGTLVIIDSILSDEGVYSCVAENELGFISKEVQVIVRQVTKEKTGVQKCQTDEQTKRPTGDIDVSGSGSGSGSGGSDDDDGDDDGYNEASSSVTALPTQ